MAADTHSKRLCLGGTMATVEVSLLSGRSVRLEANLAVTVGAFRDRSRHALAAERGRLLFQGSYLMSAHTLAEAGISDGSQLQLVAMPIALQCTDEAFAAILADGSVVTFGRDYFGGDRPDDTSAPGSAGGRYFFLVRERADARIPASTMAFEHTFTERLPQFGATLEQNAERSAKMAAWSKGIHVADPAGTMKQMFETFIGKRLLQHEVDEKGTSQQEQAKESDSSSSSSSASKRKQRKQKKKEKKKKAKKGKKAKDKKTPKGSDKKDTAEFKARLKRERQVGDAEAALDPKYAKIIDRFRQNVNPLLKKAT
ncbi:nipblb [Symbiodinium natans]|uniref:Nipblb protein n=1 Tax=Symbiodinium natans TaxID=878477 RepID=A0A812Q2G9_9DINO|nr:nipblb [Symbiodinium natans]